MAVLTAAIEARPVLDSEPAPIALPSTQEPADLAALVDAVRSATDEDGSGVVVIPRWGPRRLRETVDAARMLLGARRLGVVETSLPPLAASAAAGLLAGVARRLGDPHDAALLFTLIERQTVSMAWLSSVTGLGHLDVPFSLHVRSYVTRAGFVAITHPEPSVFRVGDEEHPLSITLPPSPRALVANRDGDLAWYSRHLLPHLKGAPVSMVGATQAGPDWWGAKRLTEIVAVCGDLDLLTEAAMDAARLVTCSWCGARARGTCSRCGASTSTTQHHSAPTKETVE